MKKILSICFIFFAINLYAHTITDMRGKQVEIPEKLERIATIDDGFIEGVMTHLNVIDKVAAIGSWSMKRDYKYEYETIDGKKYTLKGLNTMKYLHPWLNDLPCFNSAQGDILNYETLAKANPQLVILRVGDCTVSGGSYFRGGDPAQLERTIESIESLGIPLVVLFSPTYYQKAELSTMKEEMRVLGDIFKQREKALALYEYLNSLHLSVYTPSNFIKSSRLYKYQDDADSKGMTLTQQGREEGIRRLMRINLLKRLESSIFSFRLTIDRIKHLIDETISIIDNYPKSSGSVSYKDISDSQDLDEDDQNIDFSTVGNKVRIDLDDMDYLSWKNELMEDAKHLKILSLMSAEISPAHDSKLQSLLTLIENKIKNPINPGNQKIIIFTAFSDTADYLYENVSNVVKIKFGLNTAEVTGNIEGRTTIPKFRSDLNNVLMNFSPISKGKALLQAQNTDRLDILIATDCISEGQNLQDCDYLVNYDIHWNPVRIIQRFGRIDRIGSKNDRIQLVNFWPNMDLDEYIQLKNRVENRMKISVMTSTGDDNLIDAEEKGDLEYRRMQLKRLQKEVVDMEDMTSGLSIMDLGLNEFRLDLLEYIKRNNDIERAPKGLHSVVGLMKDAPSGVIFVLRNISDSVNIDNRNRIHPFYMVYISEHGKVVCDYLNPKKLLDTMRMLCRGRSEPVIGLCKQFNLETHDGHNMRKVSELLSEAINSIINTKEASDIDSLFKAGGTTALLSKVTGLDDFELICFLVVK